jgi:nitrite reductase/ring-hydroxylating ferredoxin subunit
MNVESRIAKEDLSEPLTFGVEAYISPEYAKAEGDRLWAKVWQHACRVEELPDVGDYIKYDIGNDSLIIVRSGPEQIRAFHNVCLHRGRQLVDGDGRCGPSQQFRCAFHGWRYGLDGENSFALDKDDWGGALTPERTRLREVRLDSWGGWVWINMDADAMPLREWLEPFATMLDPFELDKMRYRWRQRVIFDCNWKTAMEAFVESYHVEGTHPQLLKYADFYTWSVAHERHSNHGFEERDAALDMAASNTIIRAGRGGDARKSIADLQVEVMETVNASTTQTLVDASLRLVDELPAGTPPGDVMMHFLERAKADDAARGVIWPEIDPDHYAATGIAWNVFPNLSIQHGYTFALCYRARPYGTDPDKCIFEASVIERFPEGQEPKTEWVYAEPTEENWRSVLVQDFRNMAAVQRGMKSRAFPGALPNPKQERPVSNFHRNLARYMGTGAPRPLD